MGKHELFSTARLPTPYGEFLVHTYRPSSENSFQGHLVCILGKEHIHKAPPLVRIHSECLTGDVFGSYRCDCGQQLHLALEMIEDEGCGILIYLRGQEGRGIGIGHKIRAYELQDEGYDTVDANLMQDLEIDTRSYEAAADILKDLGVEKIQLMTNNPAKLEMENLDIEIIQRIPLESTPNPDNIKYLRTKRDRMGHLLSDLG